MSQAPAVWPPEMVVHRRFLWSLARLQLGNDDDAEDVVQETLLSAAESWERYRETTPLRAWLTGILKHKIVDVFRSRSRQSRRFCVSDDQDLWQPDNDFSENGSWNLETFIDHQCPEARASQNELLNLVEMCIAVLPPRGAQLLLMREYLGMETEEITERVDISAGNLRVVLCRARLQVRRCVVSAWGEYL